jgi:hypothetical protein
MKRLIFFSFLLILLFAAVVMAAPPQVSSNVGLTGLDIKYPEITTLKLNSPFEFEFHVFNRQDGNPVITNVNCTFNLYNQTGGHIFETSQTVVNHKFDYSIDVPGTYFNYEGEYAYIIQCNGTVQEFIVSSGAEAVITAHRGGYVSVPFEVTANGRPIDDARVTITAGVLIAISIMFMLFAGILAYVGVALDTIHPFMRYGSIMFSLLFGSLGFGVIERIISDKATVLGLNITGGVFGGLSLAIWTSRLAMTAFVIYMIYYSMKSMNPYNKEDEDDE